MRHSIELTIQSKIAAKGLPKNLTDPYFAALIGAISYNMNNTKQALIAADYVSRRMTPQGFLNVSAFPMNTITVSSGQDQLVQSTSVALILFLNNATRYGPRIESATNFLLS